MAGAHKAQGTLVSGTAYDTLKNSALVAIPGLAALYFGLAQIWGLPKAEEVVGSAACLTTFLGLFVMQQKKAYDKSDDKYDAVVHIDETQGRKVYEFDFGSKEVSDVVDWQKEILVKVNRPEAPAEPELPLTEPTDG